MAIQLGDTEITQSDLSAKDAEVSRAQFAREARNYIFGWQRWACALKRAMFVPPPPRALRDPRVESTLLFVLCASVANLLFLPAAFAQDTNADPFVDAKGGAKLHAASGFVCPLKIGLFERDAVGEADPETGSAFCAYSALDGVYGTIKLVPLDGPYNAETSLAPDFIEEEGTGGRRLAAGITTVAAKPSPVVVYVRTYETGRLEDLHYRVLFAGAQFKNWAVEACVEYAEPRDTPVEEEFLHAVFTSAENAIVAK